MLNELQPAGFAGTDEGAVYQQLFRLANDFRRLAGEHLAERDVAVEARLTALRSRVGGVHGPEHFTKVAATAAEIGKAMGESTRYCATLGDAVTLCDPHSSDVSDALIRILGTAVEIARNMEERYDGTGLPNRLKGGHIPLSARIALVVATYYSLVSGGPHHGSISPRDAIDVLQAGSGLQFDPEVVRALIRVVLMEEVALPFGDDR